MNYEEMSDYEIAVAVAKAQGIHWSARPTFPPNNTIHWLYSDNWDAEKSIQLPDYCNNPSDAWPIIVENGISLEADAVDGGVWRASFGLLFRAYHKNPLRAAMIVYLMMQEDK